MRKLAKTDLAAWIATFFGIGRFTGMPGTLGSAVACALYIFLPIGWIALLAVTAAGTWAADVYSRHTGKQDPGEVVIDEVAGMWLSLMGLPLPFAIPAFLLFRIVDILKPIPVCTAEKLPGGWGIMADDIVGGAMTNLILQGILWFFWESGWLRGLFV